MALPEFPNEAAFRTQWVAPFLSKLGYIQVTHIHGSGEQGKDFFFADYDQFEHRRFYAAQVKLGKIGAGQRELDDLLNQVRRCFVVRLRFHKEADERRISAVYIMASGSISSEAREYISDACNAQPFGENVYYLDGDTLERLDKHVFHRIDRDLRRRLIGTLNECRINISSLNQVRSSFEQSCIQYHKPRHISLDSLLIYPPAEDIIPYKTLHTAWYWMDGVDGILSHHLGVSQEQWKTRVQFVERALIANQELLSAVQTGIAVLDSRYSVSVDVIE